MAFGQGRYLLIARRTGITGPGCCLDIRDHASENSRVATDLVSIPDLLQSPFPEVTLLRDSSHLLTSVHCSRLA